MKRFSNIGNILTQYDNMTSHAENLIKNTKVKNWINFSTMIFVKNDEDIRCDNVEIIGFFNIKDLHGYGHGIFLNLLVTILLRNHLAIF